MEEILEEDIYRQLAPPLAFFVNTVKKPASYSTRMLNKEMMGAAAQPKLHSHPATFSSRLSAGLISTSIRPLRTANQPLLIRSDYPISA